MENSIEVINLSKSYGNKEAVKNIGIGKTINDRLYRASNKWQLK